MQCIEQSSRWLSISHNSSDYTKRGRHSAYKRYHQVLIWAQTIEAQRSQEAVLEKIRDAKDFDLVGRDR